MANANTSQEFHPTITITNDAGQNMPVQSQPAWASSDETVVTVAASADGMGGVISCVAPGTARVTVSADADLGDGVKTITGVSEDIVVSLDPNAQASVINFNLGAPVPKGTTV